MVTSVIATTVRPLIEEAVIASLRFGLAVQGIEPEGQDFRFETVRDASRQGYETVVVVFVHDRAINAVVTRNIEWKPPVGQADYDHVFEQWVDRKSEARDA